MKAYLASPLGFSEAGLVFLRLYKKKLSRIFKVVDPWETILPKQMSTIIKEMETTSHEKLISIGRKNEKRIRDCDILIAVLDGTDVDSGTAAEIGFAYGIGKRVYGYRGDFRKTGDNCNCTLTSSHP
ncbi:MAG: nucleoside 2-deoxyribosyltransferase [Thermoplasmata archaeon]